MSALDNPRPILTDEHRADAVRKTIADFHRAIVDEVRTTVERDAVVLSAAGSETRVELRPAKAPVPQAKVTAATQCRLAASDRAAAIVLDPAVVKALTAERATFSRMFEPAGATGGIRARGTGGTTAMFAIQDGDVLLRADGAPLRAGEAIVTEILSRLEAGGSVLVDGTRAGAPRRWVYAAKSCAT